MDFLVRDYSFGQAVLFAIVFLSIVGGLASVLIRWRGGGK